MNNKSALLFLARFSPLPLCFHFSSLPYSLTYLLLLLQVDLDQLLRTIPGSGVLSLQLRNHPKMVGKRLSEVFASVPVFALSRGDRLVWNPDADVQLRYDDVLVCYGELTELRASLRQAMLGVPREALLFDEATDASELTEG